MSLADDCLPEECLEICAKTIEKNLVEITKNVPTGNECSNEVLAKKYTILGSCFREIKAYVREALKSVQIGSDGTAFNLMEAGKHKILDEFADAKIELSTPDGDNVETTLEKFNHTAEAVEGDPGIADRAEVE